MKTRKGKFLIGLALMSLALNLFSIQSSQAGTWITNSPLTTARMNHTATLLPNGKVLIAGGLFTLGLVAPPTVLTNAEIFDPVTGTSTPTGPLNNARYGHTATLLSNGKVLVAGGRNLSSVLSSMELYDPNTGTWTSLPPLNFGRYNHTATLLSDMEVLFTGGTGSTGAVSSAERYAIGSFAELTGNLNSARSAHTATFLSNGKVLVIGGKGTNGATLASAELFDPNSGFSGTWTMTSNSLANARQFHTATLLPNGKVLVAGGERTNGVTLSSVELYDPASGVWTAASDLNFAREFHSATLLPNGEVLVAGGSPDGGTAMASTEIYDPSAGTWTADTLNVARLNHTATMLPNGKVFVAGGGASYSISGLGHVVSSVELYDLTINPATGTWTRTGGMSTPREFHTATLLPNGQVLVAGGTTNGPIPFKSAELFNPATGKWSAAPAMQALRRYHTATLLPDGTILVAGGNVSLQYIPNAEVYSTNSGWAGNFPGMNTLRQLHTATLLPTGKVLVVGGQATNGAPLASAELFNPTPSPHQWTLTGAMNEGRCQHTAILLPNNKVLVVGGNGSNSILASAEVYDPTAETWTTAGTLLTARYNHSATLLPNGKVLVAGGLGNSGDLASAELYDPSTGTWTNTGALNTARDSHTAILLPNGKVLVSGGSGGGNSAELYDPLTGTWTSTGALTTNRAYFTTTLLPDGRVLAAGGTAGDFSSGILTNAELYNVGLGFSNSWQPQITSVYRFDDGSVWVIGSKFRGIAEGSGGNTQDSPADIPVLQLRSIESGQTIFLLATGWQTSSIISPPAETPAFVSAPVWNFPPGFALATIFVNGIQSTSGIVNIRVPTPLAVKLTGAQIRTNGSFQFSFTNNPGALFGVQTTTNLSLPSSNWMILGGVVETSPGQFQFTDPQATNGGQRFYRLRSP
jgi:N-acetylneuraminic acid mutarotase